MALASAVAALLELPSAAPIDQCEGCFAQVTTAYEAQPVESADLISALAERLGAEDANARQLRDYGTSAPLLSALLDSLRLLLRQRDALAADVVVGLMLSLLSIVERASSLAVSSLRCLLNLLFDCAAHAQLFLQERVDSIACLSRVLGCRDGAGDVPYFVLRILHMIVCQSPGLLSRELQPSSSSTKQLCLATINTLHCWCCLPEASKGGEGGESSASDRGATFWDHPAFPVRSEANRLFMEGGKLLFALSVHEVLSACEEQRVWEEGPSSSSSSLSSLEQVLSAFDACVVGYLMRGVEEAEVALQLAMYVYTSQQSVERLLSQALMDLTVTDSDSAVVAPVVTLLLGLLGKAEAAHSSSERAAILTPCLVLLTNLATHSPPARVQIKLLIFPNSWTALPRAKGTAEIMDPKDAPKGSLRQRLLSLMISLDAQLKRCAAELLFMLCDEDPDEFTSRTGFGNAVALLQIKGLC